VKVLLVTGQLAEDSVKRYAKESKVDTEILALKIAVAAFIVPETIVKALDKIKSSDYNMILVPGLLRGDTALISKAIGIPAFKGPKYAADLPTVLDLLCDVQLSTTIPADELMRERLQKKALEEIEKVELKRSELLKKKGSMLIGNLAVGKDFPMRVLAEIVDAALMDKEAIQKTAKRFVDAGADIIDVGMVAGESQPKKAKQIVEWVKQVVTLPVSIDTLDSKEVKAAIEAGADLVLSGDAGNIEEIAPYLRNAAVVLIPTNQQQGYFPKKAIERVKYLEEIIIKAKQLGLNRCIADLIVDPLDIFESFLAFKDFAKRNPDVPLFVGISNVTELIDADSIGVNAVLARLASEVGGSILLATEKSDKVKGTVAEEVAASKMMFLAKKRGSAPKDLGIDLLILKDKKLHEDLYDRKIETHSNIVEISDSSKSTIIDPGGSFRISIDRDECVIVASHYILSNPEKPSSIIKGKTAQGVYSKIIQLHLVNYLDHVAYLGEELAKAEIALNTGKGYLQDSKLFNRVNCSY
jgi:dihydropteroate synthase-like protein